MWKHYKIMFYDCNIDMYISVYCLSFIAYVTMIPYIIIITPYIHKSAVYSFIANWNRFWFCLVLTKLVLSHLTAPKLSGKLQKENNTKFLVTEFLFNSELVIKDSRYCINKWKDLFFVFQLLEEMLFDPMFFMIFYTIKKVQ